MAAKRKPRFDQELCVACSACVEDCPVSCLALGMAGNRAAAHRKPVLGAPEACTGCSACERTCPVSAIVMEAQNEGPKPLKE